MALFRKTEGTCGYETVREGEDLILYINCKQCNYSPSIEDSPTCMARTITKLVETPSVTKIVFSEKRDVEYDYAQTLLLMEIANLYKDLMKQKTLFSYESLGTSLECSRCINSRYNEIHNDIINKIKSDPVGAYITARRYMRRERITANKTVDENCVKCIQRYISILNYIMKLLDNTKMMALARPHLAGYRIGDRGVYRNIFYPIIKPDFMYTKLMANYPSNGEEMDTYTIADDTEVTIFKYPNNVQYLYHVMPPEFQLSEDKYELLDTARTILAEHKPKQEEFTDPERMRQVFFNISHDLIEELAGHRNIRLTNRELNNLATILVRYTVGFGLIEVLLQDEKIQDISINSPMGKIPIYIVHGDFDDCKTNIIPTKNEAESWASKLRMISGRPLDEADPILDTELELPGSSARVSVITKPLNPTGLAYSFRRHRDRPWTLPLFIKQKMITPEAAGLLSFLVDGTRTMLVAGTRGAGKSSLLSSLMIEIMRRYRVITVEDTLELPTTSMRKLGFNIQPMKVASALASGSTEMSAADGIRSTLRLGDSALIVGEVRSKEALALYEAMRVGAAANVVAGTIHGDSPYGVFDRVVNDIGVPRTSFKATDIIIVANPIRSADGIHRFRRVTQITEVRKHWENDPVAEKGFADLMKYDAREDKLVVTDAISNGDSDVLKAIAANIKEFAGDWDSVWNNIMLRAKVKQKIVEYSDKIDDKDMLEAGFVITCNDMFHLISDKVRDDVGSMDPKQIYAEWHDWLKKETKKRASRGQ
ncbi:type II/IV secretion system ATPase subunit [Candidatus Woesearchaeota archaeon]|nr:type II/IV secretion system ATPase subunit [Candidatus Woesearchaeota archaeon]